MNIIIDFPIAYSPKLFQIKVSFDIIKEIVL